LSESGPKGGGEAREAFLAPLKRNSKGRAEKISERRGPSRKPDQGAGTGEVKREGTGIAKAVIRVEICPEGNPAIKTKSGRRPLNTDKPRKGNRLRVVREAATEENKEKLKGHITREGRVSKSSKENLHNSNKEAKSMKGKRGEGG